MANEHEFGSEDWVGAIGAIFERRLAGVDLSGISYAAFEEFTDPPAHLLRDGQSSIGWHFTIEGGVLRVKDGPLSTGNGVIADYDTIMPLYRDPWDGDEAARDEGYRLAAEATEAGKLRRVSDGTETPAALEPLSGITGIHDDIARITR